MSFFGLDKVLTIFSDREKNVSNKKKQEEIDKLYNEITTTIVDLAEKVKKINEYKQQVSENPSESVSIPENSNISPDINDNNINNNSYIIKI